MSIFQELIDHKKKISVTGLGYVGLPLAIALSDHFQVIGYDRDADRVGLMRSGIDPSSQIDFDILKNSNIYFTDKADQLTEAHFHIIAVPTDVNESKEPDLSDLIAATMDVSTSIKPGDYIIYESTVYPGCTEELCLPIILSKSNLLLNQDDDISGFSLGYSPERVNPGDKVRGLKDVKKIVSGHNDMTLDEVAKVYGKIIEAGIYKANSIKVAEAAKVVENTQRDLNISLVNELAIIFDKLGIETSEVLDAASSKWNFHDYRPGLVGGHCISIDPFYLLFKSKQVGHSPEVIAAGRSVNEYMPRFIAEKLIHYLETLGKSPAASKVLIMGTTFKKNVPDIRNSKVFSLISELETKGMFIEISDPIASSEAIKRQYGYTLIDQLESDYDAVIIAVAHDLYKEMDVEKIKSLGRGDLILFDLKSLFSSSEFDHYWSL